MKDIKWNKLKIQKINWNMISYHWEEKTLLYEPSPRQLVWLLTASVNRERSILDGKRQNIFHARRIVAQEKLCIVSVWLEVFQFMDALNCEFLWQSHDVLCFSPFSVICFDYDIFFIFLITARIRLLPLRFVRVFYISALVFYINIVMFQNFFYNFVSWSCFFRSIVLRILDWMSASDVGVQSPHSSWSFDLGMQSRCILASDLGNRSWHPISPFHSDKRIRHLTSTSDLDTRIC